ncbi:MAG: serine hydrolase domain-containing protein, partial [Pseudomonadota bacterium]
MPLTKPRRLYPLLMLAILLLSGVASGSDPRIDRAVQHMQAEVMHALKEERIPGAAWAIVHRGQIVHVEVNGYTDRSRAQRIDQDTVFRIASVSKGFAGVLASMLATEGSFSLQDPIARYAPSFSFNSPRAQLLTVEDILGQRSGLVPNAYDNLIESGMPRQEIYGYFETLEPVCPPSTCYSYQNSVFSLVEEVVETSTAVPYPDLLKRRIFQPLGMRSASVGYAALMAADNRAAPHVKTRSGWREITPRSSYYPVSSAAGINASIRDMAIWANAMLGHSPD